MQLIIIRGLPGSGKSAYAAELAEQNQGTVISIDRYFEIDGEYAFNSHAISRAYGYCEGLVEAAMTSKAEYIIVDGVHQSLKHLKTYKALASKYSYEVEAVYPPGKDVWDVPLCHKYSIHRVPYKSIQKLKANFEYELEAIKEAA